MEDKAQEMAPKHIVKEHKKSTPTLPYLVYRTRWFRYVLSVLSGILLFISFPPLSYGLVGWVALVPLLIAVYSSPTPRIAAFCGLISGVVFYSVSLSFLINALGFMGFLVSNIFSVYLALFSASAWATASRIGLGKSFFLLPIFWTGIEHFRSETYFLKFPWLALGYSQSPHLALIQFCDTLGVYGLSFIIVTVNALAAWFVLEWLRKKKITFFPLVTGLLVICFLFIYGVTRPDYLPRYQRHYGDSLPTPTSVVTQTNTADRPIEEKYIPVAVVQDWSDSINQLLSVTGQSVHSTKETLAVWPEAYLDDALNNTEKRGLLEALVRDKKLYLVFGNREPVHGEILQWHNYAVLMGPNGAVIGKYAKRIPVQGIESLVKPGDKWGIFDTPLGRIGIFICYEGGFTKIARWIAGVRGAEILILPTLETAGWGGWSHQIHAAMIPFRAIETRRAILRSAALGYSMIIHPSGRVEGRLGYLASGVLRGEVPMESKVTFYVDYGYQFPILCMWLYTAFLAAWIGLSIFSSLNKLLPPANY
ncbi:MAG: apolipoprotein N-acyltransferase [Planctomycetes bacterium]|nr:apolipoprotein N-acyltransferase [Planctomycetota bacterium]